MLLTWFGSSGLTEIWHLGEETATYGGPAG
jgi:hypothetical protein